MRKMGRFDILAGLCGAVGLYLLAENLGWTEGYAGSGWPLTVTLAGVATIVGGHGRGRYGRGAIGVGAYLVLTSLLFLYLNLTSWSQMADMWPLFVGFLGVSIFASGVGGRRRGPILFLSVFLVLLSLTFYLVFTVEPTLWPTSLLFLGVSLLFLGRTKDEETDRVR